MDADADGYSLVVPFDRTTEDFARGVEVGMLWQRLQSDPLPVVAVLHASNAEMALRLGEARGASVQSEELDDDWLTVTYGN
jgi:hypothetical protein